MSMFGADHFMSGDLPGSESMMTSDVTRHITLANDRDYKNMTRLVKCRPWKEKVQSPILLGYEGAGETQDTWPCWPCKKLRKAFAEYPEKCVDYLKWVIQQAKTLTNAFPGIFNV
jgi:hypothetical protein